MDEDYFLNMLNKMVRDSVVEKCGAYKPNEVLKIMNWSYGMFIIYCNLWESPGVVNRDERGLEFWWHGSHRRIPHSGLADWLSRNDGPKKLGE